MHDDLGLQRVAARIVQAKTLNLLQKMNRVETAEEMLSIVSSDPTSKHRANGSWMKRLRESIRKKGQNYGKTTLGFFITILRQVTTRSKSANFWQKTTPIPFNKPHIHQIWLHATSFR